MNLLKTTTTKDVENKGQNMIKAGRVMMFLGLIGLGVFVLMSLIALIVDGASAFLNLLSFDRLDGIFALAYLLLPASYLTVVGGFVGIWAYFYGMHLFALGRVAVNTDMMVANPAQPSPSVSAELDELPEL